MAKNNQKEAQQEQVATTVSGVEEFFKKNQKWIEWAVLALLIVILAIFAINRWVIAPAKAEAQAQMFPAEQLFRAGNFEAALNGDGNTLGFNDIISNYGKRAGKAVYLYAGLSNLQLGNNQEALDLLKKYSVKDKIMQGRAYSAIGDAYSNLKDYTNALAWYKKAAALEDNEFRPAYLLKAALVSEETGDLAGALSLYQEIKTKYPQTVEGYDVQKYISRIENQK
ncbi:MAG: tetratricopeptide repeat protein [Bacteroidales bacterium]|jgi:tetratricopeptide (TPR) repeat protein|nr:tetratricopeptide repeat protein [Bacteroidales bacterium]